MDDELSIRRNKFIQDYKEDRSRYSAFATNVLAIINNKLSERKIIVASSIARSKEPKSLEKKCNKKIYDDQGNQIYKYSDFRNEIMDLAGVRIVTYLLDDIKEIDTIIRELFYVQEDDSNNKLDSLGSDKIGYLSVHYIIKLKDSINSIYSSYMCEIQVRTALQDAWAQIFHDRQYKNESDIEIPTQMKRRINLLAGSLELLDNDINDVVKSYDNHYLNKEYQLKSILDKSITRNNLQLYFNIQFNLKTDFYDFDKVQSRLKEFGITKVREFDSLVEQIHIEEDIDSIYITSADTLVFYIMIIIDSNKYFTLWGNSCIIVPESYNFLSRYIDIKQQCQKYNIPLKEITDE